MTLAVPVAVFLVLSAVTVTPGQGYLVWEFTGTVPAAFGWSVALAGDVDGDGQTDVVVGAPHPYTNSAFARVYSGATGAVLFTFGGSGLNFHDLFGWSVAGAGDVNGDGFADVIVGAPNASNFPLSSGIGRAYVFSGADGSVLFTFPAAGPDDYFGFSVDGGGDVNGDGIPDLAVGSPRRYSIQPGRAKVFSGANGALLLTLAAGVPGDFLGVSVAFLGDMDGDGLSDIVVGAPSCDPYFVCGYAPVPGSATVFSGGTGAPLLSFVGGAAGDDFGLSVAGPGDVDGDGVPEVFVGSPGADPAGVLQAGEARLFSGLTPLFTFSGTTPGGLGWSVSGAGDVNGDGVPDLAVGAPWIHWTQIYSGSNGAPLYSLVPGGNSISGGGDVDGDGIPDVLVGHSLANQARVFSVVGVPGGSTSFGAGCAGSGGFVPLLQTAGGAPSPGNGAFTVVVSRALGGAAAILILGASSQSWLGIPLPLNLGPFGLPGCSLLVALDVVLSTTATGLGPGSGVRFLPAPIPSNPALSGSRAYLQWFVFDPGSTSGVAAMSRGLDLYIP